MKAALCLALAAVCLLAAPVLAANSAPNVSIVSPEEGLTIVSQVVTVEVSYAAAGKAVIEQVELVVDGLTVDARVFDPAKAKGRTTFTWAARNYADGEHTIAVRAVDSSGEVSEAQIMVMLRGAQRSLIRITSPKPGDAVSGKTTIQVEADPTLARYVIFLVDDVFRAMTNVRPFTYVWDTTRYLNGKHTLKATAVLADDREVSSSTVEVVLNNPSGATTMRAPEPKAEPVVAPAPLAPPARASEPTLPPAMRTESPTPAPPPLTVSLPDLAVPGTAPFVSASGDLIQPPFAALAAAPVEIAALPAPIEVAALPTPVEARPITVAPAAPIEAAVHTPEAMLSTATAADSLVTAAYQPSPAPLEVALLDAPPAAPLAVAPAAVELAPLVSADAATSSSVPTPAPLEIALLEAPLPAPAALLPAEVSPAEASLAPASAPEAQAVEAAAPVASTFETAMLPPMPVSPTPAPKLTALPAPSPVVYTVRAGRSLAVIAAEVGVPTAEIARANNLTDGDVHAGQRLVIPSTPVYFDRRPLATDAPVVISAGYAIAPFRTLIEQAGGQVTWDSGTRRASATARGHQIAVTIGSDQAQVDGGAVTMAAAAELRCDRTVVPLRFLGDALDLALQYEGGVIHVASAH